MKGKSKASALAIVVAVGALAVYGIAHSKMMTGSGYYIYNNSMTTAFNIEGSSTGCSDGTVFPGKVPAGMQGQTAANQVKIGKLDPKNPCQATYLSEDNDSSKTCHISVTSGNDGVAVFTKDGSCTTTGTTVTLGAS